MRKGNLLEIIFKLPLIGGLLSAILLFVRIFFNTVKSPVKFVPGFSLASSTTMPLAIEFLLAGLVVIYLSFIPFLHNLGELTSQPVFLTFMLIRYLFIIPAVHFSLRWLGSTKPLNKTIIFWLISIGLIFPINILFGYPVFLITEGDGLLYGGQLSNDTLQNMKIIFDSSDERARILIWLLASGVVVILGFYILQMIWIRMIYEISMWRCFVAMNLGGLMVAIFDRFIYSRIWAHIEKWVVDLAKFT